MFWLSKHFQKTKVNFYSSKRLLKLQFTLSVRMLIQYNKKKRSETKLKMLFVYNKQSNLYLFLISIQIIKLCGCKKELVSHATCVHSVLNLRRDAESVVFFIIYFLLFIVPKYCFLIEKFIRKTQSWSEVIYRFNNWQLLATSRHSTLFKSDWTVFNHCSDTQFHNLKTWSTY